MEIINKPAFGSAQWLREKVESENKMFNEITMPFLLSDKYDNMKIKVKCFVMSGKGMEGWALKEFDKDFKDAQAVTKVFEWPYEILPEKEDPISFEVLEKLTEVTYNGYRAKDAFVNYGWPPKFTYKEFCYEDGQPVIELNFIVE